MSCRKINKSFMLKIFIKCIHKHIYMNDEILMNTCYVTIFFLENEFLTTKF